MHGVQCSYFCVVIIMWLLSKYCSYFELLEVGNISSIQPSSALVYSFHNNQIYKIQFHSYQHYPFSLRDPAPLSSSEEDCHPKC